MSVPQDKDSGLDAADDRFRKRVEKLSRPPAMEESDVFTQVERIRLQQSFTWPVS